MTLTKSHIIDAITLKNEFTHKKSIEIITTPIVINTSTFVSGEDVVISGFGKFCFKEKRERRGRNPATREDLILAPRRRQLDERP